MLKLKDIVWLIAGLLVIINVVIDSLYVTAPSVMLVNIIDKIVQVMMLFAIACAIALIISGIPFRGMRFSSKFNFVLPFALAFTAALMNLMLLSFINQ